MPLNNPSLAVSRRMLLLICLAACVPTAQAAEDDARVATASLRGRVVWLADAMKRRFGVETDADAAHQAVALETPDGKLYGIVKDPRGRGFLLDPRWRDIDLELYVRTFAGSPLVQIIRVYSIKRDRKYELDYWCDICAIPMYELKECECCQGPIKIRERVVEEAKEAKSETRSTKSETNSKSK